MNEDLFFSSEKHDWATPQIVFNELNKEFKFTIDVCASDWNAKLKNFWNLQDNALSKDWSRHRCFMNPPYGREIKDWIKKAYQESQKGALIVALIPARTDTAYWHEYIQDKQEVRFVRGRIKFERPDGAKNSAPFPSAIVIFRNQ